MSFTQRHCHLLKVHGVSGGTEWVWSICGMIPTGENLRTRGRGGPVVMPLWPKQIPTWSGLEFTSVLCGDRRWRNWLRHCATIRKVVGSIPSSIIGIFHWHTLSCRTMAMGSTPPLNRNEYQAHILQGKDGRCGGLAALPFSCADCIEIWEHLPPEIFRACTLIHLFCLRDKRPAIARTMAHPSPLFCLLLSRSTVIRLWRHLADWIILVGPGGTCESHVLTDCVAGGHFLFGWTCTKHLRNKLHLKIWFQLFK